MPALRRYLHDRRPLPAAFSLALLAGALLGCGRDASTIRIGGLIPLTGEAPSFGESARNGYELAAREWNERGGVLGRRLELRLEDDRGDPAASLYALTKLIEQDRIVALLGATTSRVSLVAAPLVQAAAIPMVSPNSSDPKLTGIGDYIFRVGVTDQTQGEAGARFAWQELKLTRAACLFDTGNPFAVGLAQIFKARFTSLGGTVVGCEGHAPGAANLKPQVARLLHGRPDLLFLPDFYQDALLIAREARALGFKGTLLGGDGWDSPRLAATGGRDLEAGFFTSNFSRSEDRPAVRTFVQRYQNRYQSDPDAFAAMAYDAANVLFDAIRRAGSTAGPALKAALARTDFPGVSGQIRFDSQRNPIKATVIIEIRNGTMRYRSQIAP